jgi:uncharacterized repeat protein (TIGR01451 family)
MSPSPTRTIQRAAGDASGRLAARPARLLLRTVRAQQKAFAYTALAILLLLLSGETWSATPPNTPISNTANADFTVSGSPLTATGSVTVNTAACTSVGIKIELLQYNPAGSSETVPSSGAYSTSGLAAGPFVALPDPTLITTPPQTISSWPASLNLSPLGTPGTAYAPKEPVFVRVTSYDANTNPLAADTVLVSITTSSGDSELVRLDETGPSTGVFVGVAPSSVSGAAITAYDGVIATTPNETITATYTDNCAAAVTSTSTALTDPYGIVFNSATGAAVDGATVSLIDTATNLPATVMCDDGFTQLVTDPVTHSVTSGSPTNCDATMIAGGFRFPQVAAGSYKLVVVPPAGNVFPSAVSSAGLPATVGSPAAAPVILGSPGATPGGSYGGAFTLSGPAVKVDVPLDSGGQALSIQKTSDFATAGIGEFVPYTLSITNNTATPYASAQITDYLPQGFRYQNGSARQNGATIPDPTISTDASTMTFTLGLPASATVTVRYVVEVTPAAQIGPADNTAAATGGLSSNTAHASVVVTEDLYSNKSFLVGRVIDGSCDDKAHNDIKGLANARIVLEDGTYILTDQEGRWHIDNLRPGTHVVQLDLDSLPKDYEVVACEQNDRFAGRAYSQFVNLQGGTLWRADFHVQKKAPESVRIKQTLGAQPANDSTVVSLALDSSADVTGYSATVTLPEFAKYVPGSAKLNGKSIADPDSVGSALIFRSQAHSSPWQDQYSFSVEDVPPQATIKSMVRYTPIGHVAQNLPVAQINLVNHAPASADTSALVVAQAADTRPAKTPMEDDPSQLLEVLPYDSAWLAIAQPGDEWLHPQEDFHPNLPVIRAAVKHAPDQSIKLSVNGEEVDPLHFDGEKMNKAHTISLSTWSGVRINEGNNKLELVISDAQGKAVSRTVRNIHFAATPDHIEFVPQLSRLIADGKTRPIIAVRLLDKDGVPIRRGISGEFTLNEPYRSYDRREGLDREPLTGRVGGKARFDVKSDGLAMIELEPTTQTGEAVLNFELNDKRIHEVRAWLEPGQRDWILVGFGQGTLGQKTLSGNIQGLQDAGADKQLFDQNGLAFYAKGSIRGDYLLTIAYDTTKQTGNDQLKQAVDPTQYYTLYADATQANYDAASSSRLYVKLERKQFYAMFGDFDTGLTVTDLSRYSRTLTGVKSEYKGDKAGYNAFATVTAQAYVKDEIPGNGTSGVYKLSRSNLMINSDKVRIETRDRFQSQIIVSSQYLTRYLDYDIDYNNGTLTFREPVTSRDNNFNPTYIVAEYESDDASDQKSTFGGRGSYKPAEGVEVGATLIHDGTVGASGNLQGVDATYQLDNKTQLRAEAAATTADNTGVSSSGTAWLGEVTHHEERWDAKAYMRQQGDGFGLGQQAASESATRKIGMDGRYKLSDGRQLLFQAYQQESLASFVKNSLLQGKVDNQISDALSAYYGASTAHDQTAAGNSQSNQLLGGAAYSMLDRKLTLRADAEIAGGAAGSSYMPNRLILGTDYRVTEQSKVFAEQEFARGENIAANTTRVGLRTQPWSGGEMSASVGHNINNDAERLYADLGMVQRWQINEHWQTNFSIDRTQTLYNSATPLNNDTPLPSGSGGLAQLPSASGDYIATAFGVAYHEKMWSCDGRIEIRNSSLDKQRNLQLGVQRDLDQGRSMAAGFTMHNTDSTAGNSSNKDLRLSYAHRPNDSQWIWFDRADYITQSTESGGYTLNGAKLVNNLNTNYLPSRRTQIALQYGSKYVLETIDGTDYKGYTDLFGAEIRHDINQRWDIGMFGSVMRSVNAGVRSYGLGASVGFKVVDNMWVSMGYNVLGMDDRDFSDASYRAKGPYITLRMKVDQDTFGLNKGGATTRPLTSE